MASLVGIYLYRFVESRLWDTGYCFKCGFVIQKAILLTLSSKAGATEVGIGI